MRHSVFVALVALILPGCVDSSRSPAETPGGPPSQRVRAAAVLKKPIGIKTAGDVFTPLIEAGQRLPHTRSETFTNKTDGGPKVLVELSQKDESGLETIASLIISIPPVADKALQITVTLKVSEEKQLRVKTTVAESASVQEFGPFAVE
ncbi:MAG: Hsp70 family protein [Isosphaeraceae bacterium]